MSISFSQHIWPRFRQALAGLMLVLLQVPSQSYAANLDVLLVLSGNEQPYHEFATALRQSLPAGIHVSQLDNMAALSEAGQGAGLIVTVGLKAGEWVAPRTDKPLLLAMLPSYKYAELQAQHHSGNPLSAIFVDQPWSRQVSLVRAALPGYSKVGLLHSPSSNLDIAQLRKLLEQDGTSLIVKTSDPAGSLYASLNSVLSQSDVLLAVPDGAIYNSDNIRNILLSSFRQRVPLIGLSRAYVNAGALCAVYSTPQDLATQAGAAIAGFARNQRLPKAQFPHFYNVAINREVALMLGIRIHSAAWLKQQLELTEK